MREPNDCTFGTNGLATAFITYNAENIVSVAYFYDAEGRDRELPIEEAASKALGEQQLVWFDIEASDQQTLSKLANALHIPSEAIGSCDNQPPRGVVAFETMFTFDLIRASVSGKPIRFIVSGPWLVTIRNDPVSYFEKFRERDRGESLLGRLTPLALAGSLFDCHLEEYHVEAEAIQTRLDALDSEILHARKRRSPLVELTRLRRTTARLHVRLEAHRPLVHSMLRPDFAPAADESASDFFHTLESHYERAEDALDRAREYVIGSFDLYATRTAQSTNDLVRTLTIVTVATGLSAAIAGIFGMNFDIPFFHTGIVGFAAVTGATFCIALGIILYARHRGWF